MNFSAFLKEKGYDFIEGVTRDHKLLQIWKRTPAEDVCLYYKSIDHAFNGKVVLPEFVSQSLDVDLNKKNDFEFNIGITVLDELLKSLGMGNIELTNVVKSGKSVSIKYENSYLSEVPEGDLTSYLSTADFLHPNTSLLKDANRNNLLVISGVVFAQNLTIEIGANHHIDIDAVAQITKIADGKIDCKIENDSTLKMKTPGNVPIPVAIKAHRMDFNRGVFKRLTLVTDDCNIF